MKEKKYIIWLNDPEALKHPDILGNKAANLARLYQMGLPVPVGFCITTEVWEAAGVYFSRNTEEYNIKIPFQLSYSLKQQIIEAFQLLCDRCATNTKVAVRSSAVAEDLSNASFAGQYKSVLNVTDEKSLLDAVQKCWQSAVSKEVEAYRTQRQLEWMQAKMPLIVQVMVEAEFSGVLFTSNPLKNEPSSMLIELSPGSGEGLSSGKVMPVRLTIDRNSGNTIESAQAFASWGIKLQNIDWSALLKQASQAESIFQAPQDIEWAYSKRCFWILQSRKITTTNKQPCRQIWSRANAGEIMPNVITPLTWSIFKPTLQAAGAHRALSMITLHWKWQHPCGNWPDSPRLFNGRAYMELASVYTGFGSLPGITPEILRRLLGFEFHLCRENELPKRRPRWHVMDIYRGMRYWMEMLGFTRTLIRKATQWLKSNAKSHLNLYIDFQESPQIVREQIEHILRDTEKILALHIQCTSMAFSSFGLLEKLTKKHVLPHIAQTFQTRLISDFQNIKTVEQGIAIWELAESVRNIPSVARLLLNGGDYETILAKLKTNAEASDFLQKWQTFIDNFGNRSSQEFELSVPKWDTDPSFVLDNVKQILKNHHPDPRGNLAQQQVTSKKNTKQTKQQIKTKKAPWRGWLFERYVRAYRLFVPLRENLKYALIERFNILRKLMLLYGEWLVHKRYIGDKEDIFFLEYSEILQIFNKFEAKPIEVKELVKKRRTEYQIHQKEPAADLWISVNGRESPVDLPDWENVDCLQGTGCSPGRISGPAFVLKSLDDTHNLASGQILIAPSIDPGLTPLFLSIIGVVTEIGGVLSHGATVAREYGLPAVVGVPHATRKIRMGQWITIDGLTGSVYLKAVKEGG